MLSPTRVLVASLAVLLAGAGPVAAQTPWVVNADSLRAEWTVATTRAGRAQVVGYLYNRNIMDAASVWIRVDQLADGDRVAETYRRRMVGDVLARGRSFFEVEVGSAEARYQVSVEAASWVKECR